MNYFQTHLKISISRVTIKSPTNFFYQTCLEVFLRQNIGTYRGLTLGLKCQ